MAIDNQPNDLDQQPDAPQQALASLDAIALGQRGASRRRFARAGAGATGVLLTLTSQPGMACDICMAPSGFHSYSKTMTKASHAVAPVCNGKGPAYWRSNHSWPNGCHSTTKFGEIFDCKRTTSGQLYATRTCMDSLKPQWFDSHAVGMYLMAMYLNVLSKKTSFMTIADVRNMWREYHWSGYYVPTAGVKWDASDIVFYLSGTMD